MSGKTIRRDWLKRQIEAGKMEVRCNYSFTDDYAFDDATGFGKTDWMPARIRRPLFEKVVNYVGNTVDHCVDDDRKPGYMNFDAGLFEYAPNVLYRKEDGTIRFSPMACLSYTLREVQ